VAAGRGRIRRIDPFRPGLRSRREDLNSLPLPRAPDSRPEVARGTLRPLLSIYLILSLAFGSGGFVAVGQDMDTEFPLPTAWRSPDGLNWTKAVTVGHPGLAGETGLNIVIAYDDGFLASGYRLRAPPTFWTSIDGSTWTQTDDSVGLVDDDVQALAASDDRFIAGGEWAGAPFLWSTPH
jgi:hypothetical protein